VSSVATEGRDSDVDYLPFAIVLPETAHFLRIQTSHVIGPTSSSAIGRPASAKTVRDAVKSRVEAGRGMDLHYDHPILLLQHMLGHESYHHSSSTSMRS
jgi:hypothetical protein